MCVTDAATNTGASENVGVTKDTTAPTVTIDLPAGSDTGVSDTDNITKAATLVFDVEFSENVFGLDCRRLHQRRHGDRLPGQRRGRHGDSYDITLTSCSEGTVGLRLATAAVTDTAGDGNAQTTGDEVLVDKTAPVIAGSAANADASPYVAGTWTNQSVTVSFTCADTGSVQSGIEPTPSPTTTTP